MILSREKLLADSTATGFRPEVLEKVFWILHLLETIGSHPFLRSRLVLKGGTALNLFYFDLPRLSVDVDLNYVGALERETMLRERPQVEQAIQAVCLREGMEVTRLPEEHAGGKWRLRYSSALGGHGHLEIDLNYMFRQPLWPSIRQDSKTVGSAMARGVAVQDLHELAAGKLAALLARRASRDLFDAHLLLTSLPLDARRMRLGFVLYGAMNRRDWRDVSMADVGYDSREVASQLAPVVRRDYLQTKGSAEGWAAALVEECRQALSLVLPFSPAEREFLDRILDHGEIQPSLLTSDKDFSARIAQHPLLQWKAFHVRKHKHL